MRADLCNPGELKGRVVCVCGPDVNGSGYYVGRHGYIYEERGDIMNVDIHGTIAETLFYPSSLEVLR